MRWRQPKIFISYRRDDSAVRAHSLSAELVRAFGERQIFFDVKVIQYGDRFAPELERNLKACDVVVAVIGPQWQTLAAGDGQPRILSPHDYVRHELATALSTGKRVIPVLVEGARMPEKAKLPEDIAALADINALTFSDRQLGEDAQRLVEAIAPPPTPLEIWLKALARLVGLAAALAMVIAAWLGAFDFLALDTKTASFTLWLADTVAPVQPSPQLQMIVIDPDTERVLGKSFRRNPGVRRDHADLIRALAQAGAKTVAFDVFIATPSATDDAELVSAIKAARALKTAVVFGVNGFNGEEPVMVAALRSAVSTWAVLCVGERLGYAGTVPLASQPGAPAKGSEIQVQAVGLALAAASPGRAKIAEGARKVIVSGESSITEFPYSEIERISRPQKCQVGRAGDAVASALYRMPTLAALNSPERRLKYETVRTLGADALGQRFQGKTVLVGLAYPGEDVFEVFHGWNSDERHGLELHAGATSALLGSALLGDGIVQPLGWWGAFIPMTALGLFGGRLAQWKPAGRAWPGYAVLFATVAGCVAAAVALCLNQALLVNLTYPVGALLIGFWGAGKWVRRASRGHSGP
jgi:CHASE2 domain-containing sensor protein